MAVDHNNPQSRDEEILIATIDGTEYNKLPQSRMEELLLELKEVIEEGSGGGGIRPIGVTTTPLYDGATTNPIQINEESYTAETGDMVTYQSTEFLFNVNEVWQELGDVSEVLEIIDDIFADIAPAFNDTSTYAVGDYVIYNDQLYKCDTAHTGAWAAADFTATSLSEEIKNNKGPVYTSGNNIKIDNNNNISVNRWAVPAGKVVYTVITSDENYGQNVHVQRHTLGGGFIDDRTFLCEMYKTVNIDGLISIYNPYSSFRITLLENSDEQQAGYNYTVNPITTPTSNSFTFMMEQEENDNDLIIRSELDEKQDALTFDDTPTDNSNNPVKSNGIYDALANKQNVTDNNLTTTDKTTTGAINELKSGLTNLTDAIGWDNHKNLLPMTLSRLKSINNYGTWNGNTYTYNGISFTVNQDDNGNIISIIANGTATGSYSRFWIADDINLFEFNGCVLSGCPTGGGELTYRFVSSKNVNPWTTYAIDDGNDATISGASNTEDGRVFFTVYQDVSVDNVVLKPMISKEGGAFQPYYPVLGPVVEDHENRIEDLESGLDTVKSGLTNAESSITVLNANRIIRQGISNQTSAITLTFSGKGHTRVANMVLMLANQAYVYMPIPIMFTGVDGPNMDITSVVVADNDLGVTASGLSITIPSNLCGWGTHLLFKLLPDDNITVTVS